MSREVGVRALMAGAVFLLLLGTVALLTRAQTAVTTVVLVLGVGCLVMAAFSERLEGNQSIGWLKFKLVKKVSDKGDHEGLTDQEALKAIRLALDQPLQAVPTHAVDAEGPFSAETPKSPKKPYKSPYYLRLEAFADEIIRNVKAGGVEER